MSIDAIGGLGGPPPMMGGAPRPDMTKTMEPTAKLLGISADELKQDLQSGTTLSQLADEKGVSRSDLLASIKQGLKEGAPAGVQAPDDATLDEIAGNIADDKRPQGPPPPPPPSSQDGSQRVQQSISSLADALGVDPDQLLTQLNSDGWLDSVAKSRGLSTDSSLFQGLLVDQQA
jgi:hypothetical protein